LEIVYARYDLCNLGKNGQKWAKLAPCWRIMGSHTLLALSSNKTKMVLFKGLRLGFLQAEYMPGYVVRLQGARQVSIFFQRFAKYTFQCTTF
jgi:hypothetical protein